MLTSPKQGANSSNYRERRPQMTIRESIRSQWETIKNRSAKEKLSYLWDYYGIKAICALVALILLIAFVTNMATKKDYAYESYS